MNITFQIIKHNTPEYFSAVRLRESILRKPLGLTFLPEELEEEKNHIQVVGFEDNEIIATAVLVPKARVLKMQRVVVKIDFQCSGIGSKLLSFCEDYAKEHGISFIYCHARDSAVNFYLRNHYKPEGEYFYEDTIPHLKMYKIL